MPYGLAKTIQFWPLRSSFQPEDHRTRVHQGRLRPDRTAAQGQEGLGGAGPPFKLSQSQGNLRPGRVHPDGARRTAWLYALSRGRNVYDCDRGTLG
jgi:hypothetical protein